MKLLLTGTLFILFSTFYLPFDEPKPIRQINKPLHSFKHGVGAIEMVDMQEPDKTVYGALELTRRQEQDLYKYGCYSPLVN